MYHNDIDILIRHKFLAGNFMEYLCSSLKLDTKKKKKNCLKTEVKTFF